MLTFLIHYIYSTIILYTKTFIHLLLLALYNINSLNYFNVYHDFRRKGLLSFELHATVYLMRTTIFKFLQFPAKIEDNYLADLSKYFTCRTNVRRL